MKWFILLVSGVGILGGCAIGPSYERPVLDTGHAYEQSVSSSTSIANLPWWDLYRDETLQKLIHESLINNRDLKTAVARIAEAKAALAFTRADQFPAVNGVGSAARGKFSENLPTLIVGTENNLRTGGEAFYEADLWGKLRRATESSQASLLATEENRRTVTLSLVAQVASTYMTLRSLDERLDISSQTLKLRGDYLRLVTLRFKGGVVSQLDVEQAAIQEAIAASNIPSFERAIRQTEHALCTLLGRRPGRIERPKDPQILLGVAPVIPTGLPAELLDRRPDIQSSAAALHAQMAQIGVAQAFRLPQIILSADGGYQSTDVDNWFKKESTYWTASGSASMPILDFGKSRARVNVAKSRADEALEQYHQTFLLALQEVEDGLVAVRTYRAELAELNRELEAARSASRLSQKRYEGGVSSYLEVIDAERTRFNSELLVSETRAKLKVSVVQLYKALGGGWKAE